jgi:hypothetical protein
MKVLYGGFDPRARLGVHDHQRSSAPSILAMFRDTDIDRPESIRG